MNTSAAPPAGTAPVSALISVYAGDDAEQFRTALESMYAQMLPCAEIVVVVDGPVSDAVDGVIAEFEARGGPGALHIVRSEQNRGLGNALNLGLQYCTYDVFARMDADDISEPERIERQWAVMSADPDLDLVAAWHAEFQNEDPDTVTALKKAPEDSAAILRTLRWRNCISHPTIMVRKEKVLEVGGYGLTRSLEDYQLYMRMLARGATFRVLQEPLVKVRVSPAQRMRRGGFKVARDDWELRYECYRLGFYTIPQLLTVYLAWAPFRFAPPRLKAAMYRLVRKPASRAGAAARQGEAS